MDYIMAFIVGGLICVIGQILLDTTKLTPAHVLVLFVTLGAIFSGIGIYQLLVDVGGAGATIPLTGFGHNLVTGVIEDVDKYGLLGVFTGGLTSAAGGVTAAVVFGYLMAVLLIPSPNKEIAMFVDVIGLLLTIIIVSPRYWITVLSICFVDLALTVLISITLESNIIGVTAGGIFTSFVGFNNKNLFQLFGPFLYLLFGIGLHKDKNTLVRFNKSIFGFLQTHTDLNDQNCYFQNTDYFFARFKIKQPKLVLGV